jgi:ABC-2 type transport system ATP-binding protein
MLEVDGLRKRYGDTVALDGVSLTVRAGEMFGFVGANGAG